MKRFGVVAALLLGFGLLLGSASFSEAQDRVEKVSKNSFNRTVRKLDQAFKASRLLVLGEFDYQKMIKMAGKNVRPAKGFAFFRPDLGIPIFDNDPGATLDVPLKLLVREKADGTVAITYRKPSSFFKDYDGLSDLGKRLDGLVDKLTDAAVK